MKKKNPHAQALGSLGGKALKKKTTFAQRSAWAKKAVKARELKRAQSKPPHTTQ